MSYTNFNIEDDCDTCKTNKYKVTIDNLGEKIWLVEELSILLYEIKLLGFTKVQATMVAEDLINMKRPYPLFVGDKVTAFKVIDKLLLNKIQVSITKKIADIFK